VATSDKEREDAREELVKHIDEAYAMEQNVLRMLDGMIETTDDSQMRRELQQHKRETERQAELVRGCIERRGGSTSAIKDAGAKMVALGQAMSGMFVGDEVMKATIASASFEAMEISSYTILIATAEQVGDTETARVCQQILREEEAMFDWLKQNAPSLTKQYLRREETPGVTAKH
jgi:ferritin-like metal-binding protein YciE